MQDEKNSTGVAGLILRCVHGSAIRDGAGEALEPPCGCRADGWLTVARPPKKSERLCGADVRCPVDRGRLADVAPDYQFLPDDATQYDDTGVHLQAHCERGCLLHIHVTPTSFRVEAWGKGLEFAGRGA
jgi:hypothetical protein